MLFLDQFVGFESLQVQACIGLGMVQVNYLIMEKFWLNWINITTVKGRGSGLVGI